MSESTPPTELNYREKKHLLTAVFYAQNLGLGPMGEVVAREIQTWANFGYRLGHDRLVMQAVEQMYAMWKAKEEGRAA